MKYILQDDGSAHGYDEDSEHYKQLAALPKGRRPVFLSEASKEVKAYFAKVEAQNEAAITAQAEQELLSESIADKIFERVKKLRGKSGK